MNELSDTRSHERLKASWVPEWPKWMLINNTPEWGIAEQRKSVQDFLSFKGNKYTKQGGFCIPKAYKENNNAVWPLLNGDNKGLYHECGLLLFWQKRNRAYAVRCLSPLKLFLINRLRLIILTDKEELTTLSFSNKGELLTGSFWWGDYFYWHWGTRGLQTSLL